MEAQKYLNEAVERLKSFIKIRNERMMEVESVFKEKGAKEEADVKRLLQEAEMTDTEIDNYHEMSLLSNDVQTLSKKVADFIHFNKVLGTDLNLDSVNDIPGYAVFLRDYKPYETSYTLTPENKTKETNPELFKQHREAFKKALRNKSILDFMHETGN